MNRLSIFLSVTVFFILYIVPFPFIAQEPVLSRPQSEGVARTPVFQDGEHNDPILYLENNVSYPALAYEHGIQGTVSLQFVIDKEDSISNLIKDLAGGCGQEVVRAVQSMPRWIPARDDKGNNISFVYRLSYKFKLK